LGEGHHAYQESDTAAPLRQGQGGGESKSTVVVFHQNQRGEVTTKEQAGSLKQGGGKPGQGYPAVLAFQERGRADGANLECQEDLAYALLSPQGGGRAQERNIAAGMIVRRLTPAECLRLMGAPDLTNRCTIWICSDRQKKNVLAETRNPKSPLCAWLAHLPSVGIKRHSLVLCAEKSLPPDHPAIKKCAIINAVLSSVDALISSECVPSDQLAAAKIADGTIAFTQRRPSADFARLAVRMNSCLATIARDGGAVWQSLPKNGCSTLLENGSVLVVLSGSEITTLASDAKGITTTATSALLSTTSEVGKNSPNSDWNLATLCSCAVLATDSSIPERTQNESSFVLNLETVTTYLDLDPPLSDSAKYRLLGNGVVVPVAAWLGGRFRHVLAAAAASQPENQGDPA